MKLDRLIQSGLESPHHQPSICSFVSPRGWTERQARDYCGRNRITSSAHANCVATCKLQNCDFCKWNYYFSKFQFFSMNSVLPAIFLSLGKRCRPANYELNRITIWIWCNSFYLFSSFTFINIYSAKLAEHNCFFSSSSTSGPITVTSTREPKNSN